MLRAPPGGLWRSDRHCHRGVQLLRRTPRCGPRGGPPPPNGEWARRGRHGASLSNGQGRSPDRRTVTAQRRAVWARTLQWPHGRRRGKAHSTSPKCSSSVHCIQVSLRIRCDSSAQPYRPRHFQVRRIAAGPPLSHRSESENFAAQRIATSGRKCIFTKASAPVEFRPEFRIS